MPRLRVDTASFDAIRFIGALQVSTGHFNMYVGHRWGLLEFSGGVAVQIFFVMSGFVMAVAYGDKVKNSPASLRFTLSFLLRRAARIGPLYWISVLVCLPITYMHMQGTAVTGTAVRLLNIPLTLLFLNAWLPVPYGRVINFPLWTVTCQFFFWGCFPWLARRLHVNRSPRQLAIFLVISWLALFGCSAIAAGLVVLGQDALPVIADFRRMGCDMQCYVTLFLHETPLNKLPVFMLGMASGSYAAQPEQLQAAAAAAAADGGGSAAAGQWRSAADGLTAAYVAYVALMMAWSTQPGFELPMRFVGEYVWPPLFALWLLALTQAPHSLTARAFGWRPLRTLGDLSFAWYCLHAPLYYYYAWARCGPSALEVGLGLAPALQTAELVPLWSMLLVASHAAYHMVEVPARTALSAWVERRLGDGRRRVGVEGGGGSGGDYTTGGGRGGGGLPCTSSTDEEPMRKAEMLQEAL